MTNFTILQIFVDTSVYVNLKLCCINFSLLLLNFLLFFYWSVLSLSIFHHFAMLCLLCMLFFPFRFFHFLSILFLTFPLLLFVLHTFHSFTSPSISLPFFSFHFLFQVFVKPGTGPERPGTLPKNSRTPLLELLRNTPEHLLTGCLPSPYPPNPPPPPPSTLHYKNLAKNFKTKKIGKSSMNQ